jgi:hypothetical protein
MHGTPGKSGAKFLTRSQRNAGVSTRYEVNPPHRRIER